MLSLTLTPITGLLVAETLTGHRLSLEVTLLHLNRFR